MSEVTLSAQSKAVLNQFTEGLVTLSELCDALRGDKIHIMGIDSRKGRLMFDINQETDAKCEIMGWPILAYLSIPAYHTWD